MSSLLITNGCVATLDDENRFVDNGSLLMDGSGIGDVVEIAPGLDAAERTMDAGGRLFLL